ncbi:MAG: hypothetical protein JOZ25_07235 [Actinobacteria bacterium]|nr:hypothetical protein [Actinomycetota bacterium]
MLSRFHPSPALVVACIALIVALSGSAYAITNFVGPGGQIRGCVSNKGKLVLVKPGVKCKKGLSTISWNRRGPHGKPGATGLAGPTFLATRGGASPTTPVQSPNDSGLALGGRSFTFNLPGAGVVYLRYFTRHFGVDCSPSGSANAGLYLDGSPVVASDHPVNASSSASPEEFIGKTATTGGAHTVTVHVDCPGTGVFGATQDDNATWTVLLVGG